MRTARITTALSPVRPLEKVAMQPDDITMDYIAAERSLVVI